MTALSADFNRQARGTGKEFSLPVATGTTIYKGGLVAMNASGYAVPAASTAGLVVLGVAIENVVNAGADGALRVRVDCAREFLFPASSITQAMVGRAMYVVDDATIDETDSDNIFAGILTEFVSTTSGWVYVPAPSIAMLLGAGVGAVGSGYKVARGIHRQVAAADTVVTGLATVVAAVVSFDDAPTVKQLFCRATIGDQAGTPAAGSIIISTFKPTAVNDVTPAPATDFTDTIDLAWVAIGT